LLLPKDLLSPVGRAAYRSADWIPPSCCWMEPITCRLPKLCAATLTSTSPDPSPGTLGILTTKDVKGILATLLRPGDRFLALPILGHAGTDPQELAHLARSLQPHLCLAQALPDLDALRAQLQQPPDPDEPPGVVCGSLYLLGQVMQACLGWDLAC
jgi:dihydrofolate synthase/folylpolyglutamate synthase